MRKTNYNKLVRDKIPNIINKSGHEYAMRILDDDEYMTMLKAKLNEEVAEFFESGKVEEIADIIEVLYAICEAKGVTVKELEQIRKNKAEIRGSFKEKVFLKYVVDDE